MPILKRPPLWAPINAAHRLNQGLVGYWPLSDGRDSVARDVSGKKNHGTLTNMALTPTSGWGRGRFGSALQFDGSNDYIIVGNVLNFERTDAWSYAVWVKLSSATPSTGSQIVGKRDTTNGMSFVIRGDVANDPIEIELRGASTYLSLRSDQVWTADWTHLVWTYDGSVTASGMKLYRDGVPQSTSTLDTSLTTESIVTSGNFTIGAYKTTAQNFFAGAMSELRAYNRKLSAHEVLDLYRDPFGMYQQNEPVWISGAPPVDTSLSAAITIGVTTNTPTLTVAKALAAAATVSLTTTATLVSPKPLTASVAVAVTTATPVLSVPKALSATVTISATTSAALGVAKPLNAAVAIAVTSTTNLTFPATTASVSIAVTTNTPTLTVAKALAAAVSASVVTSAALVVAKPLSASVAVAVTTGTPVLSVPKGLAAAVSVSVAMTGAIGTPKPLDANVALALSCAGSITIPKPLAAVLDPIVFTIGGALAITWNSGRIIAAPTATLRAALVALGMAAVAAEPLGSTRSDGVPFGALGVAAEPSSGQRSAAVAEGALIVASASANHLAQSSVVGEPQT